MVTGLVTYRQKTQKSTVLSLDSAYDFLGIAVRLYHLLEERL